MRIFIGGDLMPGGVLSYQEEFLGKSIGSYIRNFDIRVATLESAIGDSFPFDEVKMNGKQNIIYSRNEDFKRVVDLGINVVTLANNHLFDMGADGMRNTIKFLDEYGIYHCGAGNNIDEARKPVIVDKNGEKIGFISFCQYDPVYIGYVPKAGPNTSGVYMYNPEMIREDITRLKKICNRVYVLPHWGHEYQYLPTIECVEIARYLIDCGADGVFASHTHQIQPLIKYKGKPIAFSMGNLLFPDYYMQPPRPIWYPSKNEIQDNITRFKYYPKHINEPCCQVWRHMSRIGMLIDVNSQTNRTQYKLSYLTPDNVLNFYYNSFKMRFRMTWMKYLLENKNYKFWIDVYRSRYNVLRKAFHFVNRKQFRR